MELIPFEGLGAVSYSPSIVTMAVSVAVCEIFSVKEWYSEKKNCDDMLSRFHLIPERNGQTDGQICYINIARQYADAR